MVSREQIFKRISDYLKYNPEKTVLQIAQALNINWETVRYAIRDMIAIDVIDVFNTNGKKYYSFKGFNPHPEASSVLQKLKITKFVGCANICPVCKKKGKFGSIVQITEEDKSRWLVCGYCNRITKINNE